jgi:hypothetical protein
VALLDIVTSATGLAVVYLLAVRRLAVRRAKGMNTTKGDGVMSDLSPSIGCDPLRMLPAYDNERSPDARQHRAPAWLAVAEATLLPLGA